jgi:hypothetical protein
MTSSLEILEWARFRWPTTNALAMDIFNPPNGLCIADCTRVTLGSRKVGMPKDDFADNFDPHTETRRIGC